METYDSKPKRRLFEVLKAHGMQENQQVEFFSDGGEDVRSLPFYLHPQAEHLLDWFHVTMRMTGMNRLAKGVCADDQPQLSADLEEMLEHTKYAARLRSENQETGSPASSAPLQLSDRAPNVPPDDAEATK